jgi:predicted RNA methylase
MLLKNIKSKTHSLFKRIDKLNIYIKIERERKRERLYFKKLKYRRICETTIRIHPYTKTDMKTIKNISLKVSSLLDKNSYRGRILI